MINEFFEIKPNNIVPNISEGKVFGHTYSVKNIQLWINLVLNAATSLRSASNVLNTVKHFFNIYIQTPSWTTGRLWLMRLGYYKLNRPKIQANDWVWILDHSIQSGVEKCLVVLGIRLSQLPDRPLKFSDVEPLELLPVKKSNGDIVYEQLKSLTKKTGVPMQIVSDHGSDIKSGVEKFCKECGAIFIYDIKHKIASILKHELSEDELWQEFIKKAASTKKLVQQTALAPLAPPNQRSKARYMNIKELVCWGMTILNFLEKTDTEIGKQYNVDKVKEKLEWINGYKNQLHQWNDVLQITLSTESFVRNKGLYHGAFSELKKSFSKECADDKVNKIKNDVLEFVKTESLKVLPEKKFLGSSEIIESLFGKQKYIEKDQSKSGFTGLLLSLPAIVSNTNSETIQKAMESTPVQVVRDWCKKNIGTSVQAMHSEILNSNNNSEQNTDQLCVA